MNGKVRAVATKLVRSHRLRMILLLLVSVSLLLGFAVVPIESGAAGSKIKTYGDGVWFAASTVTGVGYGDVYPVTPWGRVVGVVLETFGVVMFGSVVAFVSVELLRYQEDFYVMRMLTRLDQLEMKIDELAKRADFLVEEKKK